MSAGVPAPTGDRPTGLRAALAELARRWANTGSLLDEAGRELVATLAAHPDAGGTPAEVRSPTSPIEQAPALKPLACPYCGGEILADLQYTTHSYSEHRDLHGYECGNYECNAEWDKAGAPTKASDKADLS